MDAEKAETCLMNLQTLVDFAKEADDEIGRYQINGMIISPEKLKFSSFCVPALSWQSISYGEGDIAKVPDDQRGVYAFALCEPSAVLPPHGYVLYIGIAGRRKSKRSLRARYKDYLDEKQVRKRSRIARMIGTWHKVLRFYFVPVEDSFSSADLEKLEMQLNTALMPPFSEGDLEAETKKKRRAFK
jgi:hypothetical protein